MILMSVSAFAEQNMNKLGLQMNDSSSIKGEEEAPEGYYAFVESPNAEPPKVRPPPYIDSNKECFGKLKIINLQPRINCNVYSE